MIRDGRLVPPAAPGLGIEIDEEKLAHYRLHERALLLRCDGAVHGPDGGPAAARHARGAADELKARERAYSQELQRDGRWPHLWRVAGRYANVSVLDVGVARRAARAPERPAAVPVYRHARHSRWRVTRKLDSTD